MPSAAIIHTRSMAREYGEMKNEKFEKRKTVDNTEWLSAQRSMENVKKAGWGGGGRDRRFSGLN